MESLTELRDIVAGMGTAAQNKAAVEISLGVWCQLVFLNVHRGHSRSLNQTRVCKVDISDWDLIPTEADDPVRLFDTRVSRMLRSPQCKTCGSKIACQWPNASDQSKCRECHLQAKRCVSGKNDLPSKPRKRKRASESPGRNRSRRRCDSDGIEDAERDDDVGREPTPAPKPRHPLQTRKAEVVVPTTVSASFVKPVYKKVKQEQRLPNKPKPTPIKSVHPEAPQPSQTATATASTSRDPTGPLPSPSPPPPGDALSKWVAVTGRRSGARFNGRPDEAAVERMMESCKDLDLDGCKRELGRTKAELQCALGNMRMMIEAMENEANKERALVASLTAQRQATKALLHSYVSS